MEVRHRKRVWTLPFNPSPPSNPITLISSITLLSRHIRQSLRHHNPIISTSIYHPPGRYHPHQKTGETKTMTITTICYSYSGVTRGIAEKIQAECGGELIEVTAVMPYTKFTAYAKGCLRAMMGEPDPVKPSSIDVSASDLIVIGTPVWAFRAAPPTNGAVQALTGCEGKTAVIFATCGAEAKDTLPHLAELLTAKGVEVTGEIVLDRNDVLDTEKIDTLIAAVKSAAASVSSSAGSSSEMPVTPPAM
jgi:flavodoxin